LKKQDKDHRIGRARRSTISKLLARRTDVAEKPENEAWTKLIEGLDVKAADGGVKFAPNKPLWSNGIVLQDELDKRMDKTYIINKVPRVAAKG
jgi:hypothetical protein